MSVNVKRDGRSDYMDDLAKDARIRQYARMLPMGDIPQEKHQEVRDAYLAFTYKYDLTDAKVAKTIGIGASTLSQWKNGKYQKGDQDKITRLVNDYMEREGRKFDLRVELPYVPTRVARQMISTARVAYEQQCMAAIVSPAGAGKTMVLKMLAQKMRGFYVECDEDLGPKAFMQAVAKVVGVDVSGTIPMIKDRIIEKIGGSGRPIMLDEMQLIPKAVISRIRKLHDQTECPIIMAGTEEVFSMIDDRPDQAGKRANGGGQFYSRCITCDVTKLIYNAEGPDGQPADNPTLFTMDEVAQIFDAMPLRLSRAGLEMAWGLACLPNYGTLRLVRRTLNLVCRRKKNGAISRDDIIEILGVFFGAKAEHVHRMAKKTIQRQRAAA